VIKAVMTHGHIYPIEPLPADWQEGQHLLVEKEQESATSIQLIDQDFEQLDELCSTSDPVNEAILDQLLQQARLQAKEQVRRRMGIPNG
jgi:hypothetical protein